MALRGGCGGLGGRADGEEVVCDASLSLVDIQVRYRVLAKECHPDIGGDPVRFAELAEAIREARATL